jgi:Mrp family chromosome partitioning ATPase
MNDSPLASYLVPIRRWWWIVACCAALGLTVAWITLPTEDDIGERRGPDASAGFEATHLIMRNPAATNQPSFELVELLAEQGSLRNQVLAQLDEGFVPADLEEVTVVADTETETISVTAVQAEPERAAALATSYAEEVVAFLEERTGSTVENDYQRVVQRIEEVQASIVDLEAELAELPEDDVGRRLLGADVDSLLEEYSSLRAQQRSLAAQRDGEVDGFVTLAAASPVPVEDDAAVLALPTRPALRLAVLGLLGGVLGVGGVLGFDRLDTRVRTRGQAEEAFGLPVLAVLPRRSGRQAQRHPLPALHDPGGTTSEILRALRLSISLAPTWHLTTLTRGTGGAVGSKTPVRLEQEPRSIVITSTLTGEGKSTLAANLAISLAEGGARVLVVDCDFRRPSVGKLLECDPGVGLRELAQLAERPLRDLASPTIASNVAVVRSGSRGVSPPWFMREAGELVRGCLGLADVVIFDTGPIMLTNEAAALLPYVDTGLFVVRAGRVATDQARDAVEQLTQLDATVSGLVLVGTSARRRYGSGYYHEQGDGETEASVTGPDVYPATSIEERTASSLWHTNRFPEPTATGSGYGGRPAKGGDEPEPTESTPSSARRPAP